MQFSHIIGLHQHVAKHLEKAILWAWDICVKDDSRGNGSTRRLCRPPPTQEKLGLRWQWWGEPWSCPPHWLCPSPWSRRPPQSCRSPRAREKRGSAGCSAAAGGWRSPALPALGISIPLVGARVPPGHHPAAPNCDVQVILFEALLSSQARKRGFFSMVKSLDWSLPWDSKFVSPSSSPPPPPLFKRETIGIHRKQFCSFLPWKTQKVELVLSLQIPTWRIIRES